MTTDYVFLPGEVDAVMAKLEAQTTQTVNRQRKLIRALEGARAYLELCIEHNFIDEEQRPLGLHVLKKIDEALTP